MLRKRVLKDQDGILKHVPVVDAERVLPTAATITITDRGGNALAAPVDAETADIGDDGVLSYTLDAENTTQAADGYKITWSFTYDSETYSRTEFFDIVKHINDIMITQRDVLAFYPRLRNVDLGEVDWPELIEAVWKRMEMDLRRRGLEMHLLLRNEDFYMAHIYGTLELAVAGLSEKPDDFYAKDRDRFAKLYLEELNYGVKSYDLDEDGNEDEGESDVSIGQTRLVR